MKLQVGDIYNDRDIHVQKIKVCKIISRYFPHYIRDIVVHFHDLHVIFKASDSDSDLGSVWLKVENSFQCEPFNATTAYHMESPMSILNEDPVTNLERGFELECGSLNLRFAGN